MKGLILIFLVSLPALAVLAPTPAELWRAGEMPCSIDMPTSKLRIAMDLHQGCPECEKDWEAEMKAALAERAYVVLEAVPYQSETGSKFLVGSEDEALLGATTFVMQISIIPRTAALLDEYPAAESHRVHMTTMRNLGGLAIAPNVADFFGGRQKVPGFLKEIVLDPMIKDLATKIELRKETPIEMSTYLTKMMFLEEEYFPKKSKADRMVGFREMFATALLSYAEGRVKINLSENERSLLKLLATDQTIPGLLPYKTEAEARDMLTARRNPFIERTIANQFCKHQMSGKPIIARLGSSHVKSVFSNLSSRMENSRASARETLELDARVLDYETAIEYYKSMRNGEEILKQHRIFAASVPNKYLPKGIQN